MLLTRLVHESGEWTRGTLPGASGHRPIHRGEVRADLRAPPTLMAIAGIAPGTTAMRRSRPRSCEKPVTESRIPPTDGV